MPSTAHHYPRTASSDKRWITAAIISTILWLCGVQIRGGSLTLAHFQRSRLVLQDNNEKDNVPLRISSSDDSNSREEKVDAHPIHERGDPNNVTIRQQPSFSTSHSSSENNITENNNVTRTQQHHLRHWNVSKIMFLHVGKTGGSTVNRMLKIGCSSRANKHMRKACFDSLPPSQLSERVQWNVHAYQFHDKHATAAVSRADAYLVTIRNPLRKALSWYDYVHPDNCASPHRKRTDTPCRTQSERIRHPQNYTHQFFHCFPRFQHVAPAMWKMSSKPEPSPRTLVGSTSMVDRHDTNSSNIMPAVPDGTTSTAWCADLAWRTLNGAALEFQADARGTAGHMICNTHWYLTKSHWYERTKEIPTAKPAAPIDEDVTSFSSSSTTTSIPTFVVRTEHLWDDLSTIDRMVGGTGDFGKLMGFAHTHGSEHHPVKSGHLVQANNNNNNSGDDDDDNRALPRRDRQILCCALWDEIMQAYRQVLRRAANLGPQEKRASWQEAVESCGWDRMQHDDVDNGLGLEMEDSSGMYDKLCPNIHVPKG